MTPHLTDEQLRAFCARQMAPDELLNADEHLAECEECRKRAWDLAHGAGGTARIAESLLPDRVAGVAPHGRRLVFSRLVTIGAAIAMACILLFLWPDRDASGAPYLILELPRGVALLPREQLTVTIAGLRGRTPFMLFRRTAADGSGRVPTVSVPIGTCTVSVLRENPKATPRRLYLALSDLRSGRHRARLIAADNNETDAAVLARLPAGARGQSKIESVMLGASMNFFDDVKVSTANTVLFDEDFDRPDGTDRVPGLETQWPGKGAFVSRSVALPDTRGGVWVNLAYPNFNRADRVPIRPADIPPGEPLIIETRVMVTDPRAGIEIALSKPFVNATGLAQDTPMLMRFELGKITAHGRPNLMSFDPLRWYQVRIECDLASHTYNVIVDGSTLATNIPIRKSDRPGVGYDFDGVVLAGQWHGNVE